MTYRYDATYEEILELRDGSRLRLRQIRPSDKSALAMGFDQLTAASRYDRFMGHKTELTEDDLKYFTEVDGVDHFALAAFHIADSGQEEPIGTARFVRLRDHADVAEAAVTILDAYQSRGIGTLLLERLLGAAWERDIRWFHFELFSRNVGMKHLIETVSHDEVKFAYQGSGCVTAQFRVPEPDRTSVIPAIEKDSPFRQMLRNLAKHRIVARPRSTRPPPRPE
ncbi:MAG: GNAT family N-acetyltransferase [Polyangiales bacterium]